MKETEGAFMRVTRDKPAASPPGRARAIVIPRFCALSVRVGLLLYILVTAAPAQMMPGPPKPPPEVSQEQQTVPLGETGIQVPIPEIRLKRIIGDRPSRRDKDRLKPEGQTSEPVEKQNPRRPQPSEIAPEQPPIPSLPQTEIDRRTPQEQIVPRSRTIPGPYENHRGDGQPSEQTTDTHRKPEAPSPPVGPTRRGNLPFKFESIPLSTVPAVPDDLMEARPPEKKVLRVTKEPVVPGLLKNEPTQMKSAVKKLESLRAPDSPDAALTITPVERKVMARLPAPGVPISGEFDSDTPAEQDEEPVPGRMADAGSFSETPSIDESSAPPEETSEDTNSMSEQPVEMSQESYEHTNTSEPPANAVTEPVEQPDHESGASEPSQSTPPPQGPGPTRSAERQDVSESSEQKSDGTPPVASSPTRSESEAEKDNWLSRKAGALWNTITGAEPDVTKKTDMPTEPLAPVAPSVPDPAPVLPTPDRGPARIAQAPTSQSTPGSTRPISDPAALPPREASVSDPTERQRVAALPPVETPSMPDKVEVPEFPSPMDREALDSQEARDYLMQAAPVMEELSLLLLTVPRVTVADFDPSDDASTKIPGDVFLKLETIKRALQNLDARAFAMAVNVPLKYKDYHASLHSSIKEAYLACDEMIIYLTEKNDRALEKVREHLANAQQYIKSIRGRSSFDQRHAHKLPVS